MEGEGHVQDPEAGGRRAETKVTGPRNPASTPVLHKTERWTKDERQGGDRGQRKSPPALEAWRHAKKADTWPLVASFYVHVMMELMMGVNDGVKGR